MKNKYRALVDWKMKQCGKHTCHYCIALDEGQLKYDGCGGIYAIFGYECLCGG